MQVDALLESEHVLVAAIDRVLFAHWYGPPRAGDIRALGDASRAWHGVIDRPTVGVNVVSPSAGLGLSLSSRQATLKNRRMHAQYMVALVAVVPDSDFQSAIARSILSWLAMTVRSPVHHHVVRDLEEAARLAADALQAEGHTLDAVVLHHEMEELRARVSRSG